MKLIVFSKKPLFSSFIVSIENSQINNKMLFKQINYNFKNLNNIIFSVNINKNNLNLNSFKAYNNVILNIKKMFLSYFLWKQMLYFFLFKKKCLKISSFEDLCFLKSNLNKFSKSDLIFILNYSFYNGFDFLTKKFINFFSFLDFFSYNRIPGRRLYKKTSKWVSHIFFKRLKKTIQNLKTRANKTTFSLVYWAFTAQQAEGKLNTEKTDQEVVVINDSLFSFFNFTALYINQPKIIEKTSHVLLSINYFWQNGFYISPINWNNKTILWYFEKPDYVFILDENINSFFKTPQYNPCFYLFKNEYINYNFSLVLFFNYMYDELFDLDESVESYYILDSINCDVFDEEEQEELTLAILNGFNSNFDSDSDDEFLGEFSENVEINTLLENYLIEEDEDEEVEIDDVDMYQFYIDYNEDFTQEKRKRYFFYSKFFNYKTNEELDQFHSHFKSIFSGSMSLTLFFIFYLIVYPSFVNKVLTNYGNYFISFTNFFVKSNYLNFYQYYNNVYPLFLLPTNISKFVKKKKETILDEELSLFFRHHLGGFLEFFTRKKVFIKIITRLQISNEIFSTIQQIAQTHTAFQKSVGRGFFLEEMLFIMWQAFYQKDIDFLVIWFQRTMNKIEFNKHKIFLKVFKFILLKYSFFFCSTTRILGFRFDIRGKVGVTGNAKKRNLAFRFGSNGFSKKQHRLELKQGLVNTETGILGLTFILAF